MPLAELFKKQTWSTAWILVRRVPRDRRARVALLRFLLVLIVFVAYLAYWGLLARRLLFDLFGLLLVGVLAVGAFFFFVTRKWTERYDLIHLEKELPPAVAPDIKHSVFRETCLLAAMLERAASERALEKGLDPGIEVITRRVVLDKLRKHGLLDGLEASYLDLLLTPDGGWSEEQKRAVHSCWEFLVVLRWILGMDSILRPIWLPPEYHLRMASTIWERTASANLRILPPWEMRIERDRADNFFARCRIELIARNAWPRASQEAEKQAKAMKAEIDARRLGEDYLLGSSTISELELSEVWNCTIRSYHRQQILELLVGVSGGDRPPSALHSFLLKHAAPATKDNIASE
jgi:hypothetical protein